MIDEYAEELYLDLKEYWGLDLVAFISGEVLSSVEVLSTLIRNLPEGSRYTARRSAEMDAGETPELELSAEDELYLEARTWTLDRRLSALLINAINQNTVATGQWQKGKQPEFPIVGPLDWDEKRKKRVEIKKQVADGSVTTADIMRALGWNG